MRRICNDVDITIEQMPVRVSFTCPCCEQEISVDYDEFERMTSSDLGEILHDTTDFRCPVCQEKLYTADVFLD